MIEKVEVVMVVMVVVVVVDLWWWWWWREAPNTRKRTRTPHRTSLLHKSHKPGTRGMQGRSGSQGEGTEGHRAGRGGGGGGGGSGDGAARTHHHIHSPTLNRQKVLRNQDITFLTLFSG